MYSILPNLVLGFHGCDIDTYNKVLHDHESLLPSNNSYDWLGNGIYFWEDSVDRAQQWAVDSCERYNKKNPDKKAKLPAVVGAVISLGNCLNLTDYKSCDILKTGYEILKYELEINGKGLPVNKDIKGNTDLLFRDLDCAVIQRIHQYNKENKKRDFDSVRGVFLEGNPIYENAGIMEKTHVQLCIVNPNCIKGYFKPLEPKADWVIV
ncbi:MAG: hypothetical protein NC355_00990 [Blautia sp.]|nr:hypothetical protein [Blautia sp.]